MVRAAGIPLGCIAAAKRGGLSTGHRRTVAAIVPSFVIAIYLLVFAVALQWLPAIGAGEPGDGPAA